MAYRLNNLLNTPSRPQPTRWLCAAWLWVALAGLLTSCAPTTYHDNDHLKVSVNGVAFDTELKLSPESRYKGMGGRTSIADNFAMLFVFPQPRQLTFVMRDCAFPIAVLFLDAQGRVVSTHVMPIEPNTTAEDHLVHYSSEASALFALEVKAEQLEKLKIEIGKSKIDLPIELPKVAR